MVKPIYSFNCSSVVCQRNKKPSTALCFNNFKHFEEANYLLVFISSFKKHYQRDIKEARYLEATLKIFKVILIEILKNQDKKKIMRH